MEEKIKEILKKNQLYDDLNKIKLENCNKLEHFLKNYKINYSNKQKLPNNITRNEKGFILLDEIPFIESNLTYNFLNKWLILYNGTKLLTKEKLSQTSIENELLIMYFLRSLNINCTNYDIAKIKDQIYLICPNFLNIGEKILNIFNYPLDIDKLYNTAKNNHFEVHLLKTIFTDRIYGNIDRFPQNFGIILDNHEKHSRICPLYDNGEDECIFYREDNYFPYIEDEKNDSSTIFNYLLAYEEVMHWLNGPGKKANLYDAAERLKREKGFTIRDKTYTKFQNFFKDSQTIINDELKAKGKSFRMNLV